MSRKGLAAEKIIARLREAEELSSQGQTAGQICRKFRITDQTYYRCSGPGGLRGRAVSGAWVN